MSVLEGFPLVDQRTSVTTDKQISENRERDCVPAIVCAMTMYLNGVKTVGGIYTPDGFKDAACGQGYVGFTSASQFVDYCASLGVKLWPLDGNYPYLIQQAHKFLAEGKPVMFTQDDWIVDTTLDKYKGWTHVAAWYRDDTPGTLTSMDPWGGFARMKSDAGWIPLLRDNQIWIAEPLHPTQSQGDLPMLQLTDPMGHFFTEHAPDRWHCTLTGVDLAYGHLTFYRQYQGIFGLVRTNEIYLSQLPGTAIVAYERAIAIYDPSHTYDNPPGSGSVYLMHLDNGGIGQQFVAKPLLAALQAQVSQLQAQLAQDTSAELTKQLASYQEAVKQVDAIIHPLATA